MSLTKGLSVLVPPANRLGTNVVEWNFWKSALTKGQTMEGHFLSLLSCLLSAWKSDMTGVILDHEVTLKRGGVF
jgi:hypothetical protein